MINNCIASVEIEIHRLPPLHEKKKIIPSYPCPHWKCFFAFSLKIGPLLKHLLEHQFCFTEIKYTKIQH